MARPGHPDPTIPAAPPWRLTATGARAKIRSGALTSEALVGACLDRIAARDGGVGAWVHVAAEAAMDAARASDRAGNPGPLGGIPVGIKDVFLTRDMPTAYNSPIYRGARSDQDAAAVALLRQAGAILLGKTDTVEFAATGRKARTRNPHDPTRTPGASSSGSAAAVADGHVPVTLGTQTGGSIIRPASFCGTWAMKPTWNAVSNEGARRFAATLDTVGWFARSREDLALLAGILIGGEAAVPGGPQHFTALRTIHWGRAETATCWVFEAAVAALRDAGHPVGEAELPAELGDLAALHMKIMRGEGRVAFLPEHRMAPDLLDPGIRELVENVDGITPAALTEAQDVAATARRLFDRFAADHGTILAPSAVGVAPVGLAFTGDLVFNGFWTMLHVPVLNLPFADPVSGLPVGLTLAAARNQDARLLGAAAALDGFTLPG